MVPALAIEIPIQVNVRVDEPRHQRRVTEVVCHLACRGAFFDAGDFSILHGHRRLAEVGAASIQNSSGVNRDHARRTAALGESDSWYGEKSESEATHGRRGKGVSRPYRIRQRQRKPRTASYATSKIPAAPI